jgi:alkylation response protein AidB-like acyl-CoA dehydrogenase
MLTAEQLEIRALAREFARGEIRPGVAERDAAQAIPPELMAKVAELGFLGMRVPEAYGGLGLDLATYLMALEELAWGDPAVSLTVAIQNGPVTGLLLAAGSDEQRGWLVRLASGEALGAWAVAEPDAGGDLDGLTTRAHRDGDEWVLSGRKAWVTNGAGADLFLVATRTGEAPSDVGIFLVPAGTAGLTAGQRLNTLGMRASETVDLALDGVRLPPGALLGGASEGRALLERVAPESRLGVAALGVGIARAAAEHATTYALEREQFGQPIAGFEAVREKLGGMATRIASARALLLQAAQRVEAGAPEGVGSVLEGDDAPSVSAMARLVAGETAEWVASQAVQIYGGYGYMRHYPVEKLMRDAQAVQILEGTVEVLRLRVAERVIDEVRTGG